MSTGGIDSLWFLNPMHVASVLKLLVQDQIDKGYGPDMALKLADIYFADTLKDAIASSASQVATKAGDLYQNTIVPTATGAVTKAGDLYQNTIVPTATGAVTKAGEMYSRIPTLDYIVNGPTPTPTPTYLSMLSKYATENPLIASAAALGGLGLGSYGLYKLYNKATAKKQPVKKTRRARKVKSTQKTKQD